MWELKQTNNVKKMCNTLGNSDSDHGLLLTPKLEITIPTINQKHTQNCIISQTGAHTQHTNFFYYKTKI